MELFQRLLAPLVLQFGIPRTGTEKESEEGRGRGKEWEGRKPV
jgi:hypothetical protein